MPSLVLIKPDACEQGLACKLYCEFEKFEIINFQVRTIDRVLCRLHYREHVAKPWYKGLEDFMVSGPLMALHIHEDVDRVRTMALNIRDEHAYLCENPRNLVHASDGETAAMYELKVWFTPGRPKYG